MDGKSKWCLYMMAKMTLKLLVVGVVVLLLWNWLMPQLFSLPAINYWQSLGLLLLSKIFFSGFWYQNTGKEYSEEHWKQKFHRKWGHVEDSHRRKVKEELSKKLYDKEDVKQTYPD